MKRQKSLQETRERKLLKESDEQPRSRHFTDTSFEELTRRYTDEKKSLPKEGSWKKVLFKVFQQFPTETFAPYMSEGKLVSQWDILKERLHDWAVKDEAKMGKSVATQKAKSTFSSIVQKFKRIETNVNSDAECVEEPSSTNSASSENSDHPMIEASRLQTRSSGNPVESFQKLDQTISCLPRTSKSYIPSSEKQLQAGLELCYYLDDQHVKLDALWNFYFQFVLTPKDRDRITNAKWSSTVYERDETKPKLKPRQDFTLAVKREFTSRLRNMALKPILWSSFKYLKGITVDGKTEHVAVHYSILLEFVKACASQTKGKVVIIPPEAFATNSLHAPVDVFIPSRMPSIPKDWEYLVWIVNIDPSNLNWRKALTASDFDMNPAGGSHCLVYFLYRGWTHILFHESNRQFFGCADIENSMPSELYVKGPKERFGMDIGKHIADYLNQRFKIPITAVNPLKNIPQEVGYGFWGTKGSDRVGEDYGDCVLFIAKTIFMFLVIYSNLLESSKEIPTFDKAEKLGGTFPVSERKKYIDYMQGLAIYATKKSWKNPSTKRWDEIKWNNACSDWSKKFPNYIINEEEIILPNINFFK